MKRLALFICTLLCANVLLAQNYDATFCSGSLIYAYYYGNNQAVVYGYNYENPPTNIVIPSTVSYDGVTYNVIGINSKAFRTAFINNYYLDEISCSSLTSVTIPNSVTSIGEWAFKNCSSLTYMTIEMSSIPSNLFIIDEDSTTPFPLQNLTLGENVTSIASGAFNDCSFLQNVTCLATTPPTLEDNTVFPYPNIASLTVPCGTLEAYSSATSFWNMFFAGRISENGYNVEVSVNDETFGSVAVESDCSTGTLTATANEGYVFISWNDGNTDNPRMVTLTSDTSFTAIFAAIDESSLSEDAEVAKNRCFPNPIRGFAIVEFEALQEHSLLRIADLGGRIVKTLDLAAGTESVRLDLRDLPSGVYTFMIGNTTKKLIVE